MKHPEGIQKTINIFCSPKEVAEIFWGMDSDKQAEFFTELSKLGDQYKRELQWLYLRESIGQNKDAKEALMDLSAPLFVHTIREIESERREILEMLAYETP